MAKSEAQQLGYDFEDEVKTILANIQSKFPIFWHRFPDAKAARGHLAAQPADFLVAKTGMVNEVLLVETKASLEKPSLAVCAKSMIEAAQRGMHTKWHRSGQSSIFIFYCEIENKVEIWDGKYLIKTMAEGERITNIGRSMVFDYFDLEEKLTDFFTT